MAGLKWNTGKLYYSTVELELGYQHCCHHHRHRMNPVYFPLSFALISPNFKRQTSNAAVLQLTTKYNLTRSCVILDRFRENAPFELYTLILVQ